VGPIVLGPLTQKHKDQLASCYRSCLTLAADQGLRSIACCCISTGVFRFPNDEAAQIAVATVRDFLASDDRLERVVFNVFKDIDLALYRDILGA
jgi:O-acetyl-ADP-ribose deacetylase (regulator of RNase III)